jgi:hypothetical protein
MLTPFAVAAGILLLMNRKLIFGKGKPHGLL